MQLVTGLLLGSNRGAKTVSLCPRETRQSSDPCKACAGAYTRGSAAKVIARRETTCGNSPGPHPHQVPTAYPPRRCFPQSGQKCWVGHPELFLEHPGDSMCKSYESPLLLCLYPLQVAVGRCSGTRISLATLTNCEFVSELLLLLWASVTLSSHESNHIHLSGLL